MPGVYALMIFMRLLTSTGCIYLIAMYYKRYELQWRLNVFFSASIMAGAVSGVRYTSTKKGRRLTEITVVARLCHRANGRNPRLQRLALDFYH